MHIKVFPHTLLLLLFIGFSHELFAQKNDLDADFKKFEKFLRSLDEQYVDDIITKDILEEGIKRMLEELDPHSVYLDAEAYTRANEPLKGKFKGVGIRFLMVNDTAAILDIMEGGAAESAGLKQGDRIIAVNNDTVAGRAMSATQVVRQLRQYEEDPLAVVVERFYPNKQSEIIELSVKRTEVEISSVPAYFMLDQRTGYIKLERFSSSSLSEFRDALNQLQKSKVKNLVLDLRGNGGGYLNVANQITDEFLEDRKLIVYTEGEHQERKETYANSGGRFTEGDLYILVDANTASASEILAGAIQDLDRGLIVGRRTYGKGLVQRTIEFSDGSAIRLTTARYYTPTGRSIQRSYASGSEAYRNEIAGRGETGELSFLDSIHLNDSIVYYTPSNRKVYGGGGIVPDVFVPVDTSAYPDFIVAARRLGLLEGFALKLAAAEEEEFLRSFPTASRFIKEFELTDEHLSLMMGYFTKREITVDMQMMVEHRSLLQEFTEVYLCRFIYGYDSFFQASAKYDNDVQTVLKEIDRGTVKELGLK